jgi:hypothetical protein
MNRRLRKPNYRVIMRLLAVVASAVGLNLAWATSAQAAGNVEVRVENGDLIITGDDRDNNIMVIQECCQNVVVTGRAETTINGNGRFDVEGVTDAIEIKMRGGDDFVRVEVVPGFPGNPGIPDLKIDTGKGDDIVELLGVTVGDDTRIDTGDGNDTIFIDGVLAPNGFSRSDFKGKFTLESGNGDDLLEFHHAIFRGVVDVNMGSGIDGVCNTEDSEFQRPHEARFEGGAPSGFPGDGFVAPTLEFTNITGFEDFPDDCSYLGGRD